MIQTILKGTQNFNDSSSQLIFIDFSKLFDFIKQELLWATLMVHLPSKLNSFMETIRKQDKIGKKENTTKGK